MSDADDPFRKESAFLSDDPHVSTRDVPMWTGVASFCRRPFARRLDGVDLAVVGVPYDWATTGRPGARFEVRFHAPLELPDVNGTAAAIALTGAFNRLLEDWVSAHPEQWLCTKRRWPKTSEPATPC